YRAHHVFHDLDGGVVEPGPSHAHNEVAVRAASHRGQRLIAAGVSGTGCPVQLSDQPVERSLRQWHRHAECCRRSQQPGPAPPATTRGARPVVSGKSKLIDVYFSPAFEPRTPAKFAYGACYFLRDP